MTMETLPFEDVSPTKNGDFPLSCYIVMLGFGGEPQNRCFSRTGYFAQLADKNIVVPLDIMQGNRNIYFSWWIFQAAM